MGLICGECKLSLIMQSYRVQDMNIFIQGLDHIHKIITTNILIFAIIILDL